MTNSNNRTTTTEERQFTTKILDALRPYFKEVFVAGGALEIGN